MAIIPGSDSCGANTNANQLYGTLVDENDFKFPEIDLNGDQFKIPGETGNPLFDKVKPVDLVQLTTRTIGGDGVFDALMDAVNVHLFKELQAQRISGRDYADVYTASIQSAMGQAVSFLMSKDNAYWQAIMTQANARTAEINAVTARIDLENTKLEYFTRKATAKTAAADYALKKIQLSLADADYCIKLLEKMALTLDVEEKTYTNANMLPLQKEQLEEAVNQIKAQILGMTWDNRLKQGEVEEMMPKRIEMLDSQMKTADVERRSAEYNMNFVLPKQMLLVSEQAEAARAQTLGNRSDGTPVAGVLGWDNRTKEFTLDRLMPAQHQLGLEQVEGARAQTMDTRTDGTTNVVGLIGKQKDLYTQQITSYQRDAEVKAARMFIDTWVTQKTIDEGLLAPTNFQNSSIDAILGKLKITNNLT